MSERQKYKIVFAILYFLFPRFVYGPTTRQQHRRLCREAHGGRDALSKQYGILFVAKAGSNLQLRPRPTK